MASLLRSLVVSGLAFGALAACGADSPTAPRSTDLASVLAELSPVTVPGARFTLGTNRVPAVTAMVPASCAYDGASVSFTCPAVTVDGVTFARSFILFNSSGTPQAAYDKSSTAAVRVSSTASGPLISSRVVIVADTSVMTMSGLRSGTLVLDGIDRARVIELDTITVTTTFAGLVLPAQPGGYPSAGSITTREEIPMNFNYVGTTKFTFNGTSKVAVTITVEDSDGHGGTSTTTRTCTFDLENTAASCV